MVFKTAVYDRSPLFNESRPIYYTKIPQMSDKRFDQIHQGLASRFPHRTRQAEGERRALLSTARRWTASRLPQGKLGGRWVMRRRTDERYKVETIGVADDLSD